MGKIRGDYNCLNYTFYSPGLNNREVKSRSPSPIASKMVKKQDLEEMREEYGAIKYTISDSNRPRDMDVVIPQFDDDRDTR